MTVLGLAEEGPELVLGGFGWGPEKQFVGFWDDATVVFSSLRTAGWSYGDGCSCFSAQAGTATAPRVGLCPRIID